MEKKMRVEDLEQQYAVKIKKHKRLESWQPIRAKTRMIQNIARDQENKSEEKNGVREVNKEGFSRNQLRQ